MAQIESNKIPFTYNEGTITGNTVEIRKGLYTVFDSDLKKTFVYDDAITLGSRKPLATIGSDGKIIPFQENGNFIASNNLRFELQNNQALINNLKSETRNAVRTELGLNDPSLIQNVTDLEIDRYMGTTFSANNGAPPPEPVLPPPGTPTTSGGGSSPGGYAEGVLEPGLINQEIPSRKSKQNGSGVYVYPSNLDEISSDYIKFSRFTYKPKELAKGSVLQSGGLSDPNSNNKGDSKGTVVLPIQAPTSDTNTVGWSDGSMTGVEAALFNVAYKGIGQGIEAGATAAGDELNKIVTGGYRKELAIYFAQQASQVNNAFARVTGGIVNPNLELLFQGPQLRLFNFMFKLSARDEEEATRIRQIIRFFKQGMSVKRSDENLFLKSPDIFDIVYYRGGGGEKGDKPHKALNKFKTCALQSCTVDYTPLNSYMTFSDEAGTMVSYTITMQFQEIDPIYDNDYENFDSDVIGY